jgi:molybdenum cofactor synthesis domain-containing protein
MPTVGILVIGNEILSGKVADENSPYLCRELRALGVDVERILAIPDDVRLIASEVKAMSDAYDFVLTSGGIGPTHDDLTFEGVAAAFGVAVVRSDSIEERIRRAIGHSRTRACSRWRGSRRAPSCSTRATAGSRSWCSTTSTSSPACRS